METNSDNLIFNYNPTKNRNLSKFEFTKLPKILHKITSKPKLN